MLVKKYAGINFCVYMTCFDILIPVSLRDNFMRIIILIYELSFYCSWHVLWPHRPVEIRAENSLSAVVIIVRINVTEELVGHVYK